MEWIIARVSSFSIMPSIDWSSVAFRLRGFRCPLQRAYGCFRICRLLGMRSKLECIFEIGLAPAERHAVAGVLTRWAVHVFLGVLCTVSTNCLSLDVLRLYFLTPRVSSRRCGLRLLQWLLLEDLSSVEQQHYSCRATTRRRRREKARKQVEEDLVQQKSSKLLSPAAAGGGGGGGGVGVSLSPCCAAASGSGVTAARRRARRRRRGRSRGAAGLP